MKKHSYVGLCFVFLFIFTIIAFADTPVGPSVSTWWGRVNLSGVQQNTTAVVIAAISGSPVANITVGQYTTGYYLIDVPCTNGQNVTLKVYDIINSTQTCVQGSRTELNLSVSTLANGGSCTYAASCSGGYCSHNYCSSAATYCGDGYCDSGESCSTDNSACSSGYACTNGCASTGGGSTGGGSSGGGGSTPTVTYETTVPSVTPAIPATVSVETSKVDDLNVQEVKIEVTETVTSMKVTIAESSKPAGANLAIAADAGATYQYLSITTSVDNTKIKQATIKFQVEKSWATSNNIDPVTIALNRYANNAWTKLATTKASEDSTYYYFEAVSPGFSTFAITGEKKAAVVTPPTVPENGSVVVPAAVCGNGVCEAGESSDSCAADCSKPSVCGDGVCGVDEDYATCAGDCSQPTDWSLYMIVIFI
ncbi:MAG: PGF-pre-PGF domain-containing protein, partial [Candidatus Aenigmarchaeota archaeon]|nr:PGF-pre-PGF domain-containing protein [Candidatus Aenigmarchaeota archaeon]